MKNIGSKHHIKFIKEKSTNEIKDDVNLMDIGSHPFTFYKRTTNKSLVPYRQLLDSIYPMVILESFVKERNRSSVKKPRVLDKRKPTTENFRWKNHL